MSPPFLPVSKVELQFEMEYKNKEKSVNKKRAAYRKS